MQLNLTGFLHGKNARLFMQELWDLLISAQENTSGIPTVFLEKKKEELRLKKVHASSHYNRVNTVHWLKVCVNPTYCCMHVFLTEGGGAYPSILEAT